MSQPSKIQHKKRKLLDIRKYQKRKRSEAEEMAGEQVVPPPPQQVDQPPQAVDAAAAAVPLERSPARGQQLTPDKVILNLHNQINRLNAELNQKDQAIALGNATNQALEAD